MKLLQFFVTVLALSIASATSIAQYSDSGDLESAEIVNGFEFNKPNALNRNYRNDSRADMWVNLATDEDGTWVAVWESKDDLNGTIGTDRDILFAVSTDKGRSWTNPAALNSYADTDSSNDARPDIIWVPDYSRFVVAWHSNNSLGNTIGTDNDILYSASQDGGMTWKTPTYIDSNATSDTGADTMVDLDSDRGGLFLAVWQSNDSRSNTIGTDWDIIAAADGSPSAISTFPAGAWGQVAPVSMDATSDNFADRLPNGAISENKNWHVVWERQAGSGNRDIYTAINDNNGVDSNWDGPQTISASPNDERYPTIAIDKDTGNEAITVWETRRGSDRDIQYSVTTNADNSPFPTWSSRENLNTNATSDSEDDRYPQILTDSMGRWLCVWESREDRQQAGNDWDIFWSRSTNTGNSWSGPRVVNNNAATDSGADQRARIATDSAGKWLAAWHSNHDLGGRADRDRDIFVVRTINDLTGSPAFTAP